MGWGQTGPSGLLGLGTSVRRWGAGPGPARARFQPGLLLQQPSSPFRYSESLKSTFFSDFTLKKVLKMKNYKGEEPPAHLDPSRPRLEVPDSLCPASSAVIEHKA